MGALHAGHLSLVEEALTHHDHVVVSIFVNPTQFGPGEDFDRYPRTLALDSQLLERFSNVSIYAPNLSEVYPFGLEAITKVTLPYLANILCGKSRPGHFDGVLTVVMRLFNLIKPSAAYFGEKDFQQLCLIRHMVKDLHFPIEIVGCPIFREKDGVAASSRNQYLTPEQRLQAPSLYKILCLGQTLFKNGQTDVAELVKVMTPHLEEFRLDYLEIIDPTTLQPSIKAKKNDRIMVAGYLGKTRLIDNLALV